MELDYTPAKPNPTSFLRKISSDSSISPTHSAISSALYASHQVLVYRPRSCLLSPSPPSRTKAIKPYRVTKSYTKLHTLRPPVREGLLVDDKSSESHAKGNQRG